MSIVKVLRFHETSLLLEILMDLKTELAKWRCKKNVNSTLYFTKFYFMGLQTTT